ncbi:hypothetical protein Dsin_011556 [Dipteronia sinensis]|uniref:DUF4408 domain-containing protein n=1 Tax=Dipteronia sinensis TaxID=43782 RepID=A0AAE0AUG3_9ROSI|nr:hypothetical protein Dsin_011556 [Dipteronia sinensis]
MFEESVSIWASMNSWFTPTVLFVFLNLMIGTIFITSSLTNPKPSHENQQDPQQQQPHRQLVRSPSVLQRLKSINFYTHRSQEPTSLFAQNPSLDTHFTSHYTHQNEHEHEQQHQQPQPRQLTRSPSMLQRLKSINFYNYVSQESTTTIITTTIHKTQEEEEEAEDTHYSPQQELNEEPTHEEETEHEEEEVLKEEEDEHIQDQDQTLDEIYGQLKNNHPVGRTKSDTKPASGQIPKKLTEKMKKSASSKSVFSHYEEIEIVEARRPATVRESNKARVTEMDDDEVDAKADDFINKFKQQLKLQRIDSILRRKKPVSLLQNCRIAELQSV